MLRLHCLNEVKYNNKGVYMQFMHLFKENRIKGNQYDFNVDT